MTRWLRAGGLETRLSQKPLELMILKPRLLSLRETFLLSKVKLLYSNLSRRSYSISGPNYPTHTLSKVLVTVS